MATLTLMVVFEKPIPSIDTEKLQGFALESNSILRTVMLVEDDCDKRMSEETELCGGLESSDFIDGRLLSE